MLAIPLPRRSGMKLGVWTRGLAVIAGVASLAALLATCSSSHVRRVSEASALIQQLTVRADGRWSVDLRIESFSSIPMQFDCVDLGLAIGDIGAGRVTAQPAISIG